MWSELERAQTLPLGIDLAHQTTLDGHRIPVVDAYSETRTSILGETVDLVLSGGVHADQQILDIGANQLPLGL